MTKPEKKQKQFVTRIKYKSFKFYCKHRTGFIIRHLMLEKKRKTFMAESIPDVGNIS